MGFMGGLLAPVAVLGMLALASREIGAQFRRLGLPYISGFLLCGALAGPDLLAMISRETVERLRFVDEVAIAFIGFAAGAELYLQEYRDRIRPILWVTAGITAVTMPLVGLAFVAVSGAIPGVASAGTGTVMAAALLWTETCATEADYRRRTHAPVPAERAWPAEATSAVRLAEQFLRRRKPH